MSKNTKQICKKLMAIATVITVLLSCIGTGYAASFTQPEVINVFTTFNGAASAQDAFYGAESPNGTMKNANAVSDETGSKISFAGETWVEYPFDEVIKTGVLHIGFDYKFGNVNDTTGLVVRGFSNMQYPDNAGYRAYNDANGNNETWLGILNISGTQSSGKVTYPSVLCENADPSAEADDVIATKTADDEWHRYDIYVSFGAMGKWQTDYFCDGEYIGTGAATDGLKSIGFKAGKGGELDNLIIKHSTTLSEMATASKPYYGQQIDIIADYANGGVKANGGELI